MIGTLGALFAARRAVPVAVVGSVVIALVIGLVDDRRPLGPWVRFAGLAGAGTVMAVGGVSLAALGALGGAAVAVAVVAMANGVNLLDGQDALAGSLGLIAALGLAAVAVVRGQAAPSASFALGGALLAFLWWNRPPARIFLGNGGAYAVGALLAWLAVVASRPAGWSGVLAVTVCLGVFVFELCFTVARRVLSRSSITTGDRRHTNDLLSDLLGRRERSTLALVGVAALLVPLAAVVAGEGPAVGGPVAVALAFAAAIAGLVLWRLRGGVDTTPQPSSREGAS